MSIPPKGVAVESKGSGQVSPKGVAVESKGSGQVSPEPKENSQYEPTRNRQGKTDGLSDHRIDYEKTKPPEIQDYTDIHGYDPILAAMAITGERNKKAWGFWVKVLNQGRKEYGTERAERLFRGCLEKLFGEIKNGEVNNPGACLNNKLKTIFGEP